MLHLCCLSSCSYIKPQPIAFLSSSSVSCLSSCSYIKPQPSVSLLLKILGCLSSCSYIKPQPVGVLSGHVHVVYHLVPTSNHNSYGRKRTYFRLFIILFLHQTTTEFDGLGYQAGCLSSCSYIKPQLRTLSKISVSRCLSSCSYIKPQL